ncbi:MAG: tRNA 5-methoxyuridine(34)/uridine 5-oxyacetic acid(34) synthase CmoB [Porticoccus sp.]|nr:tRNA 5-methoxyuridine(34)/uridine 5-oxyacetic acid(34) synthase CmoB [Porticoccus sp.]MBQ0806589.1 tRNA 5-methoxyuridine(34)/uridine 5-oxyacetic acid(34) synthase CmoB [Porticoccus sp.]
MSPTKTPLIDFSPLLTAIADGPLEAWAKILPKQLEEAMSAERWGDLPGWQLALENLPQIKPSQIDLKDGMTVGQASDCDESTRQKLRETLMGLHPWRKGPYNLFGLPIDTEWRSDWKWDRVIPHLAPLKDRLVLDVGCGNGYHCWRMLGEGADRVIGIDPSGKFVHQFYAIKHYVSAIRHDVKESPTDLLPVDVLPVGIEQLPSDLKAFDTVFSMGVLYHRRSPMDHLRELKDCLLPNGQLVLETLVIEGGLGDVLVPEGRYAKMRNVWFLPSVDTLLSWMKKCGLKNPRMVDMSRTSFEEQRSTEWMHFDSLPDFLDPNDDSLTAEGHPAPIRAVFVAEA